jgi:hypothetical protein
VGRTYAGVLGYLAWVVVVLRGVKEGGAIESVMTTAVVWMIGLAVVGAIVGRLAAWTVSESVRRQLADEISAHASGG